MSMKSTLKMLGIDVEKETRNTLIESGQKFSKEVGCPIEEVSVRIFYAKDGKPYYELFSVKQIEDRKKWDRVRSLELKEVL